MPAGWPYSVAQIALAPNAVGHHHLMHGVGLVVRRGGTRAGCREHLGVQVRMERHCIEVSARARSVRSRFRITALNATHSWRCARFSIRAAASRRACQHCSIAVTEGRASPFADLADALPGPNRAEDADDCETRPASPTRGPVPRDKVFLIADAKESGMSLRSYETVRVTPGQPAASVVTRRSRRRGRPHATARETSPSRRHMDGTVAGRERGWRRATRR